MRPVPAARARIVHHLRAPAEASLFGEASGSGEPSGGAPIALAEGDALLYAGFLAPRRADALVREILAEARFLKERRVMYDRVVDVPREQAWFGDGAAWSRDGSDAELAPAAPGASEVDVRPWTPGLASVRDDLQGLAGVAFAYVLINRYRSGRDSVAWHNDRLHPALQEPVIASLSLGATRVFDLRAKSRPSEVVSVDLAHGDLLVMRGAMQRRYDHRVRKDPRVAAQRLNLTFRQSPATR